MLLGLCPTRSARSTDRALSQRFAWSDENPLHRDRCARNPRPAHGNLWAVRVGTSLVESSEQKKGLGRHFSLLSSLCQRLRGPPQTPHTAPSQSPSPGVCQALQVFPVVRCPSPRMGLRPLHPRVTPTCQCRPGSHSCASYDFELLVLHLISEGQTQCQFLKCVDLGDRGV